jgi:hypothetical protein
MRESRSTGDVERISSSAYDDFSDILREIDVAGDRREG